LEKKVKDILKEKEETLKEKNAQLNYLELKVSLLDKEN